MLFRSSSTPHRRIPRPAHPEVAGGRTDFSTPDKANAYYKLAESNFAKGDRQVARTNVMKALEIAPTFEPAQELLLKIVR